MKKKIDYKVILMLVLITSFWGEVLYFLHFPLKNILIASLIVFLFLIIILKKEWYSKDDDKNDNDNNSNLSLT